MNKAKILLSDIELKEKRKLINQQYETQQLEKKKYELLASQQEILHNLVMNRPITNYQQTRGEVQEEAEVTTTDQDINKDELDNDKEALQDINEEQPLNSLLIKKPLTSVSLISDLFCKNKDDDNDNDNEYYSDVSSINGDDKEDEENTQDLHNKNLEALRKRIEQMKSSSDNNKNHKSFKCGALSVLFIEYLKKMVDQNRPKLAIEFDRNLFQILKPYRTLTCNYLKLYSSSVFRSIQRNKMSLIGFNHSFIAKVFTNLTKIKNEISGDALLFIRVHILNLIDCFNKYLQNIEHVLIEFFNGHLLNDKPALFKYVYVNEHDLLEWDKYNFVLNYNINQKKMILLNFIAIRCMLKLVIFGFVEHNLSKESNQKSNLFCLASIYYYIIRSYNTKIMQCDELIEQDFEICEYVKDKFKGDKLLSDDHPIYHNLDDIIQDGVDKIDTFMENMIEKIQNYKDSSSV